VYEEKPGFRPGLCMMWRAISARPYRCKGFGAEALTRDSADGVRMLRESERKHRHREDAPGYSARLYPGSPTGVPDNVAATLAAGLQLRTCARRRCGATGVRLSCTGCRRGSPSIVPVQPLQSAIHIFRLARQPRNQRSITVPFSATLRIVLSLTPHPNLPKVRLRLRLMCVCLQVRGPGRSVAHYCSHECQRRHWRKHRPKCFEMAPRGRGPGPAAPGQTYTTDGLAH
jgi:hypothetical protein